MTLTGSDPDSFGALLKTFRQRKRLTQQRLAEVIGVNRSTVVRWEQGDYLPASKTTVLELSRHLKLYDQETRQLLEASLTGQVPCFLVPFPRNLYFTGREEVLAVLYTQLGSDSAVALTQSSALHGLGGIGKTQIALEYAYRHALEYSAIFWIGAETEEQIVASFLHMADALDLPGHDEKDQQRVVAVVQRWLSTHSQWFLIWDNLEDLDLLERFLPRARSGAILITTRCQTLGALAWGIDLLPMKSEEGTLFLLRRAKVLSPEATDEQVRQFAEYTPSQYAAATELVMALGGLPLALDQAGAYIEEIRCTFADYLQIYELHRATLLARRGKQAISYPASVGTTWSLSFHKIEQDRPAAAALLRLCAFLAPDHIPEEVLKEAAKHWPALLQENVTDPLRFNELLEALLAFSLVKRQAQERLLSLHRLVQAVQLDRMDLEEQCQWAGCAIRAVNTLFPADPKEEVESWPRCLRYLEQVQACARLIQQYNLQLPDGADLLERAAVYLRERASYGLAETLFQQAFALAEQRLGPEHLQVASLLNNLGSLYVEQGKYEQAEQLLQRALRIREQELGPDHPEVAYPLNTLGVLYDEQGKYELAEPLLQRALRIREQALGPDHPQVANPLTNLGILYSEQGKYELAEPLLQQALRIWEQALGPDHPQVAYPLNTLGILYLIQSKYEIAEPLLQRTLRIREQALGPDHPQVAYPLNTLASLYSEQGKYEQAEQLFQRALHVRVRALGPDHPEVAESLSGLANLSRDQGKYTEAEQLYQRAFSIREQHLGLHHPKIAETLYDLAVLQQKQSHLSEAVSLAERALAIRLQSLGDTHPKTVATQVLYDQFVQEQTLSGKEAVSPHREDYYAEETSLTHHEIVNRSPSENDPLQEFLDARCELHPRAWCRSADLWQVYQQWTEAHKECYPLSRGAFIAQLKAHGCRADRTMVARIWRGIAVMQKES